MQTLALSLALALAPLGAAAEGPALNSELVRDGPLRARMSTAPADLVLLYGGEQEGRLGTCGCAHRPRGGLDRIDRYRRQLQRDDSPALLVHAGAALSHATDLQGELRPDTEVRNRFMVEGLALGRWDAINLSYRDLPYLGRHGPLDGVMSANLRPPEGVELATHRRVQVGGRTVAITGVSAWGLTHQQPEGWSFEEPAEALRSLIPQLEADLVVVLAYDPDDPKALAAIEGVDVLIEAGGHEITLEPVIEQGAVWVRSRHGTEQLGELRLSFDDDALSGVLDRRIDLDAQVGSTAPLRRLLRRADRQIARTLRTMLDE